MNTQSLNPTNKEKLFWALGLGCLFLLVYGGTNTLSANLNGLPSLYLPWEEKIPFLSWMIIPYMSLDIFFIASFFWIKDRRELYGHAGRILIAIGISCALFILYPMQFGFVRPEASGLVGGLFNILSVDLPYNQCPSLHISLSLIYWPLVRRISNGWFRKSLGLWFWLIALSTLTVYQHHFIDIIGGAVVGLLIMHTIPLNKGYKAVINRQAGYMGIRYLAASLTMFILAWLIQGYGWILIYPFLSLALVASAYISGRADFLQKRHGQHCGIIWLLFSPYLLGTKLSWQFYKKRIEPWQHLKEGIYFGRKLTTVEVHALQDHRITAVLDLTPEMAESSTWGNVKYQHIPMLDFATPENNAIQAAVEFIKKHRNGVYVHCTLGLSRSALVIIAYLLTEDQSLEKALSCVRKKRSGIVLGDYALEALDSAPKKMNNNFPCKEEADYA
ncbi:MAG: hypothetical protein GY696_07310 [Gammaproteobacteria bacterium]|nr:hypothetical protein [Gammaproteobacteria bacterium]